MALFLLRLSLRYTMANKKLIEKMVKESEERITQAKAALEASEIMERFSRRKALTKPGQGDQMLLEITKKINSLKIAIKTDEEFLNFLNEIKNE